MSYFECPHLRRAHRNLPRGRRTADRRRRAELARRSTRSRGASWSSSPADQDPNSRFSPAACGSSLRADPPAKRLSPRGVTRLARRALGATIELARSRPCLSLDEQRLRTTSRLFCAIPEQPGRPNRSPLDLADLLRARGLRL